MFHSIRTGVGKIGSHGQGGPHSEQRFMESTKDLARRLGWQSWNGKAGDEVKAA
jgi:hypothetical protein